MHQSWSCYHTTATLLLSIITAPALFAIIVNCHQVQLDLRTPLVNQTFTVGAAGAYRDEMDSSIDALAAVVRVFFILFVVIFCISFCCCLRRACCGGRHRGVILSTGGATTPSAIINIHRNRGQTCQTVGPSLQQQQQQQHSTTFPGPMYQSFTNSQQYGSTASHYMAPPNGSGPAAPGFVDLPPPPPYEPPAPQQLGFNPGYTPVNYTAAPPGYSEKK